MADLQKRSRRRIVSGTTVKVTSGILLLLVNFGRIVLERGIIGIENYTLDQIPGLMDAQPQLSAAIGIAAILRLLGGLSVPFFALMTAEGFLHTSNLRAYLTAVGMTAVASEALYDFALTGSFWVLSAQNPLFGVFLCLIVLSICRLTDRMQPVERAVMRILTILFGVFWAVFLRAECGVEMVLLTSVFYLFREHLAISTILGVMISLVDSIGPLAYCILIFYNGKRDMKCPKYLYYAIFPVQLLLMGLFANRIL